MNTQAGNYTLASADCGNIVQSSAASAVTYTLPNSLPALCNIEVIQGGAGVVTFAPASGAALHSNGNHSKTSGQYAGVALLVISNAGNAAFYILLGDAQ